jgi:hypothetical protein
MRIAVPFFVLAMSVVAVSAANAQDGCKPATASCSQMNATCEKTAKTATIRALASPGFAPSALTAA